MDTLMTFINGAYPSKKENNFELDMDLPIDHMTCANLDTETNTSNSNTDSEMKKETSMSVSEGNENDFNMENIINDLNMQSQQHINMIPKNAQENQMFDDDVFDEFLNPNCFQQPSDMANYIDSAMVGNGFTENTNEQTNLPQQQQQQLSLNATSQDELKRYEEAKEQLMGVKFGLKPNSKYVHHSNTDFCYTKQPVTSTVDDPDVTYTTLPQEYFEAFHKPESEFPYKIKIEDLPTHSRVETQIKLELSVSPAPPQYLLHIPRDAVTKPRFTLADNSLPESIRNHLLFLDVFVIGSDSLSSKDKRLNSCNVCKRCMRRELKRASRRKSGLIDDLSNWDLNLPKRAIILNTKQIVSFPPPNANTSERKLELLSRIVCYCRHHQEQEGFRIMMFLKDQDGKIVGKVCSTPILIMDRKKSAKTTEAKKKDSKANASSSDTNLSVSTTAPSSHSMVSRNNTSDNHVVNEIFGKTSLSVSNLNVMNILNKSSSSSSENKKSNLGMFSSIFSFDPSSILGDENSRQVKRQKRQWSQSQSDSAPTSASCGTQTTYYESITQKRMPSTSSTNLHERFLKKDLHSPAHSPDAISPQTHMMSSAASVFSSTPERKVSDQMTSITTPPYNTDVPMEVDHIDTIAMHANKVALEGTKLSTLQQQQQPHQQQQQQPQQPHQQQQQQPQQPQQQHQQQLHQVQQLPQQLVNENTPTIKRIIPAQGPIRGGIEITLLGNNFKQGLNVKFGSNLALATQCWSESTIVTYLPPASQAGPVLVTFEDPNSNDIANSSTHQIFTYTDDTDRQLIELALQIVGLKMNGKLEDAKNIAKRIVGNNQIDSSNKSSSGMTAQNSPDQVSSQQLQLNWMAVASNRIRELSESSLNHEEILIKFLDMVKIPNSLISNPNWAVCNSESQTLLHLACFYKYNKLAKFLIQNGSRVHYKDNSGFTPLHYAFIVGNRKIINYLIRFRANASNKLDNGLLLSEISDPNVLDLINMTSQRRYSDASIDQEDDDDYIKVKARSRAARRINSISHLNSTSGCEDYDCDSEADDEEDENDSLIDVSLESGIGGNEKLNDSKSANSFGVKLWVAMRAAIKNKLNENQLSGDSSNDQDNEPLPSYDDLFPTGGSLRSLINFRSYTNDEDVADEQQSEKKSQQLLTEHIVNDTTDDDMDKDGDVDRLAMTVRKSLNSDTKLLFFWLPCMLFLSMLIIGHNLNFISFRNLHYFSLVLEKIREYVGSFMLGKDRFTNLINENINYGREKMENLLHDVNGAVMTAVVGVGR